MAPRSYKRPLPALALLMALLLAAPESASASSRRELTASGAAAAESAFRINSSEVNFGGSGCPQGSVSVVASPDEETLSILFDSYAAMTDEDDTRDRLSCNVALPVHVPNGISLGIFQVDYRGYAYVPNVRGARATMRAEYFWAGQRGPVRRTSFKKGYDDDFTLSDTLVGASVVWSPCGEDVNLRINTSIEARKRERNTDGDEVEIGVDTQDITVDGKQLVPFFNARVVARRC